MPVLTLRLGTLKTWVADRGQYQAEDTLSPRWPTEVGTRQDLNLQALPYFENFDTFKM